MKKLIAKTELEVKKLIHDYFFHRLINLINPSIRTESTTLNVDPAWYQFALEELGKYRRYFEFRTLFDHISKEFTIEITDVVEDNYDHLMMTNVSNKLEILYLERPEFSDCIITGGIVSRIIRALYHNAFAYGFDGDFFQDTNFDIDFFIYGNCANTIYSQGKFHNYRLTHHSFNKEDYFGRKVEGTPEYAVYVSEGTKKVYNANIKTNVIVKPKFDTPLQVISEFDYEHCKPYWLSENRKFYISQLQLDAIKHRKLIGKGEEKRLKKYLDLGWKIENE